MRVTILGCGEAFDERLPNTCLLVESEHAKVLLDCGYSAPPVVWRAVADPAEISAIYISHGHADHYFGIPALLGRMWEDGRTKPLTIFSQAYVLEYVRQALELGYKGLAARYKFPIEYRAVEAGRTEQFEGLALDFAASRHAAPNLAVRIKAGERAFCYSGDGMFTDETKALFAGADLVAHEAFSFEPSPVHADIEALARLARDGKIGKLAFVHVQRGVRRSPGRILEIVRASEGRLALPEPGERFEI
jgi:ribonuclease Z